MRRGRCNNFEGCSAAADRRTVHLSDRDQFQCPECGNELRGLGFSERFPAAFLVLLALQIAFFGFVAWEWTLRGPRKAFAKTNPETILRMAGSNTIGSSLGPALAEGFLKQLGATDIEIRAGREAEEKNVSGRLPGASSRSIITIAAHGSATAFAGLAQGKCDIGAASRKIKPDDVRALASFGDMTSLASEHVPGHDA